MDRRRRPTPLLSRFTFRGGRRAQNRRREEQQFYYVDRIRKGLATALVAIFVFHVLDAVLTIRHLERGGSELNPLMDALLQIDNGLFLVVKLGLAGVGLFLLGLHQNFPHVRTAVTVLFGLFLALVGYHIVLIAVA